eukprot:TRINITY_DN8601_c0_g1_i1.p1 TRINITY_DN8601_c0_g1~~TRINITY_DN8601_c0_g1_i1.p1  ORF type:complete len:227 (+),score=30.88 TRINITY_DN8601_c0_g1_i1:76-756(+)
MAQNFRWINDGPASPPVKIGAVVSEPSFKPSGTVLCSGRYNGNRQTKQFLFVNHGNVLEENVDGLVCPTDKDFSMCAGLSRVVYEKAGKSFQQQIEQMRANISNRGTGKSYLAPCPSLKFKNLILTCGPGHDLHLTDAFEPTLMECIRSALTIASLNGFQSVILTAIGAGTISGDASKVTKIVVDSSTHWLDSNPNSSIRNIIYQDTRREICDSFASVTRGKISSS